MIPSCSYVSTTKNVGGDNIQQRSQKINLRKTEIRTYFRGKFVIKILCYCYTFDFFADFDASYNSSSSDYQPESEPSDDSSDDNIPLAEFNRRIKKKNSAHNLVCH